jgi:hypothetical protein
VVLETLGNDIVQSARFFASGRLFSKYRCRGTRQEDDGLPFPILLCPKYYTGRLFRSLRPAAPQLSQFFFTNQE